MKHLSFSSASKRVLMVSIFMAVGCFLCLKSRAQPQKRDSMIQALNLHPQQDTVRAKMLFNLSLYYKFDHIDTTLLLLRQAEAIAQVYDNQVLLGRIWNRTGSCWFLKGDYPASIKNLQRAAAILHKAKRPDLEQTSYRLMVNSHMLSGEMQEAIKACEGLVRVSYAAGDTIQVALSLDYIASLHVQMNQYAQAIPYQQKALEVSKKINRPKLAAKILYGFSKIYADVDDNEKAADYAQRALTISIKMKYHENTYSAYQVLAQVKLARGDTAQHIHELEQALHYATLSGSETALSFCNRQLSLIHYYLHNYTKAYQYNKQALDASKRGIDSSDLLNDLSIAGMLYGHIPDAILLKDSVPLREKFNLAIGYHQALLNYGERKKLLGPQSDALWAMSETYSSMGLFSPAYESFKRYTILKDSAINNQKKLTVAREELKYQFKIREDSLHFMNELTNKQLAYNRSVVQRQQQQLLLAQREKDLDRLRYLQQQDAFERMDEKKQAEAKQQQLRNDYAFSLKDKTIAAQRSEIAYSRNLSIVIGIAVVLLLVAVGVVYYHLRKTARYNKVIALQNHELESLHKVKDRLFSVVSHDLRSPLGSLVSFVELLGMENITPAEMAEYSKIMKENLVNTWAMTDNLLKWAHSQMEGFHPNPQPVQVQDIVEETMSSIGTQAAAKQLTIHNLVEANLQARADKDMLQLIIRNLLSNAIKFSRPGNSIYVASEKLGEEILIHVQDEGLGMPSVTVQAFNAQKAPELMRTTVGTHEEKGSGLGLFLSRTFAEMMKGSIQVASSEGKGTTFTVRLPKK